jgi:hypothetical protein
METEDDLVSGFLAACRTVRKRPGIFERLHETGRVSELNFNIRGSIPFCKGDNTGFIYHRQHNLL